MGCAAAVGLPLTEREERRSLTLLTGHASDGPAEHDWAALARPGQMLAIYMGVGAAGHIQARLLAAGIDPATPVTVVENGTLPAQKVALTGTIGRLVETLIDAAIKGPAMIFVGAHPSRRCRSPRAEPPGARTGHAPAHRASRSLPHDRTGDDRQPAARRRGRVPRRARLGRGASTRPLSPTTDGQAKALEALGRQSMAVNEVVDAYLIEVAPEEGGCGPSSCASICARSARPCAPTSASRRGALEDRHVSL